MVVESQHRLLGLRRLPLAGAILAAIVLTTPIGCTRAVALPTWCQEDGCVGGGLLTSDHGVLHESVGCIWLTIDDGTEHPVLWPAFYTVDFSPLTIMNRVGWHVATEGTSLSYKVVGSDLIDPCGRSPWVAVSPPDS